MWDLAGLIHENNRIAVEYMMRGYKLNEADTHPTEPWTLDRVAAKLRIGPPLLSSLMDCCMNFESIHRFVALIRRFLPENEQDILSQRRDEKVGRFCNLFAKKYFPLNSGTEEMDMKSLVWNLPITLAGMSYTAYHDLEFRPGYLLLLSLVVYPYAGCDQDELRIEELVCEVKDESVVTDGGLSRKPKSTRQKQEQERRLKKLRDPNGPRIPLLEKAGFIVGAETAQRIPLSGWDPQWLHKATDGTKFDGVGLFADWACARTGCVLLDYSYHDCPYQEGAGEPTFLWSKGNVESLAHEWPKMKEVREKIDHIVFWLEADPQRRFPDLVEFLCSQPQPPKPAVWEYDSGDHFMQLETEGDEEDEDDDEDEETRTLTVEDDFDIPGE